MTPAPESGYPIRRIAGLTAGPIGLVVLLLLEPPTGMSPEAWRTASVGLFMATCWITEALPIPVTALVPLLLFPLLGIMPIDDTASPYANPVIFLFMGGFMLALAMQRHHLHQRIALSVVRLMGMQPHMLVLGFMIATAFVSMWVSNTATAVMMLPIGLSVVQLVQPEAGRSAMTFNFATALMLGIAYASSIGGLGTLIGTPPNALLAAFMLETYGVEVGFAQWLVVGVPLVVVSLPLCWLLLTRVVFPIRIREIPGGRDAILSRYHALGPISGAEKWVGTIFVLAASLWILRPALDDSVPGLTDTGIAMGAALLAFIVPTDIRRGEFLLDWESAERLPWGVLLLFGGGLALAQGVTRSGLAEWIGASLGALATWPTLAVVVVVTTVIVYFTELTSNTATAAAFMPLVASLAIGIGENPFLLTVAAALSASCAFMLPVATPPNAIVYGSGYVTVPQMARAGILLNILFIILITGLTYTFVLSAFGIELGSLPDWASRAGAGPVTAP